MVTDADLAEWERLCREATPEPWRVGKPLWRCLQNPMPAREADRVYTRSGWSDCHAAVYRDDPAGDYRREDADLVAGMWDYEEGGILHPANSAFIAAARTALPALIAEVRRLRAGIAAEVARDRAGG
jgi:hypothetical protein